MSQTKTKDKQQNLDSTDEMSEDGDNNDQQLAAPTAPQPMAKPRGGSKRIVPVHQSRIADRPAKVGEKDSSLKIKIELDLEVEVEIYARVKGDITIGLM
ncbi:uncharacterized protein BDZ99DRAFT_41722 [Mytilinidion resinicola]|uniref:Uncharacterized protein n=1 Tax=Mytilinidion resinicola TaxID=574789 RepID=A0A6A6YK11_9PEZI|nr:uncharacterized protein BDZ99DRAFT_41722 [Mytilinidion resinicola]KAF2808898.1 hypothetical protein BDZ99DRAFT_41722 [Mytilinidion resinicola]